MLRNNQNIKLKQQHNDTNFNLTKRKNRSNKIQYQIIQQPYYSSSKDQTHKSLSHNFIIEKSSNLIRQNLSAQKKKKSKKQISNKTHNQNQYQLQQIYLKKQSFKALQIKNKNIQDKNKNIQDKNKKDILQNYKEKHIKNSFYFKSTQKQKQFDKQKQKDKKQKDFDKQKSKNKISLINLCIGSKLRKKLQNYLYFLNLINYSLKINYKAPKIRQYTVYIGKGNNSKLIKNIFKNRFWWNVVTKINNFKQINLVWTQRSKPHVFAQINKVNKVNTLKNVQNQEQQIQIQKKLQNKNQNKQSQRNLPMRVNNNNTLLQDIPNKLQIKKYKNINKSPQIKFMQYKKSFNKAFIKLSHNHIQGHQQITNKKSLFYNLKQQFQKQLFSIVPLTFHVSNLNQGQSINENSLVNVLQRLNQHQNSLKIDQKKDKNLLWIVKPGQNSNRGCGIQVFRKIQQIKTHIQKQKQKHTQRSFIIQKYINPFLYHRRKFDIRCFLLVTTTPFLRAYYYPKGYIRTSSYQYSSKNCSNKFIHLTNDAIQKKQQQYGKYQKGNKVTYEQFQKYLDLFQSKKQFNFFKQIIPKIKQHMLTTVKVMVSKNKANENQQAKRKLNPQNKIHSFQLYGYDFMIDQNFNPWLIEINTNPCIETGCQVLQDIIPSLLQNVLKISVDTAFLPPKLEDWPLNQILTCPQLMFQDNLFELIFDERQL